MSSLRRKPSDPKTTSTSVNRQARRSVDRPFRSTTVERRPSLTVSDGSSRDSSSSSRPLSFKETSEEVQRPRYRPQKNLSNQSELSPVRTSPDSSTLRPPQTSPPSTPSTEEESEETPEVVSRPRHPRSHPTLKPWKHQTSHSEHPPSSGSSSPNPPPSPRPSPQSTNTSEEVRRPRSKPPLAPKPRIPRHGPVKPAAPPSSLPTIGTLVAPTKPDLAGPSSPLPSPSSLETEFHLPGGKAAAEEDPPVREGDPASAGVRPEEDGNLCSSRGEVKPRLGNAAITSA